MRTAAFAALPILGALLSGCGETMPEPPPPAVSRGPHGGISYRLPGDRGHVELVNEPAVDARSAAATAIVFYLLQPDSTTPLAPPPMHLHFRNGSGPRARAAPLAATPNAGDPAGAGRFASEPGPYGLANVRGTLTGTIGGERLALDVAGERKERLTLPRHKLKKGRNSRLSEGKDRRSKEIRRTDISGRPHRQCGSNTWPGASG